MSNLIKENETRRPFNDLHTYLFQSTVSTTSSIYSRLLRSKSRGLKIGTCSFVADTTVYSFVKVRKHRELVDTILLEMNA